MNISSSSNSVNISGNIKSINDFQAIKTTIDSLKTSHESLIIHIKDSISITSSVIGYFNKIILKDGIELSLQVGNEQLVELFDDLNLSTLFNVRKIA